MSIQYVILNCISFLVGQMRHKVMWVLLVPCLRHHSFKGFPSLGKPFHLHKK